MQRLYPAWLASKRWKPDPKDIERINRLLKRYEAHPKLLPFATPNPSDPESPTKGLLVGWAPTQSCKYTRRELELTLEVLEIAKAGRITALKRCDDCTRWLFAKVPHQRFCSDECKEHFHLSSEASKTRRVEAIERVRDQERERWLNAASDALREYETRNIKRDRVLWITETANKHLHQTRQIKRNRVTVLCKLFDANRAAGLNTKAAIDAAVGSYKQGAQKKGKGKA